MKVVANMWLKFWVILLLLMAGVGGNAVRAQNVPGCDPLGKTPVVDFQLTYDPATNRYTAWYIPTDNTLHRTVTGQFTIIAPNGFTTPGGNGRDANFQITNINGTWSDYVLDNELVTSVGASPLATLNGLAVHQVGMAPAGIDIDPDGAGPLSEQDPVTPGVAVPLFSFPGNGCASVLRILVNDEPVQNQVLSVFGANLNNEISIQIPRAPFVAALQRYCKNATLNTATVVLPDIQDDSQTICATTTYTNNYFTQVLRNWNPASLPAGTSVVPTANQVWNTFTVTPASLQGNVNINPTTGEYTITFPTINEVTQPGSLTICNSLRDVCDTSTDQACVVISWLSSGTVSITNDPTVCLSNGIALIPLTATEGFTSYSWTGPGLTASTGNPTEASLSAAGVYSYTVVATSEQSCTATSTTSVTVVNSATVSSVTEANPTSCGGTDGTVTLNGLVAGQIYTITYTKNGVSPINQSLTANGSGQILISDLSAGEYSITVQNGACTSSPILGTLTDPNPPSAPILTASSMTICLGGNVTLTASGSANATFNWTGANLSQTTGSTVTATPNASGTFVYTVTQMVGGCVSVPTSVTVTVNLQPTITATALSATACVGGSLELLATPSGGTPGYTYSWTGPNFSTTTTVSSVTITNAALANTGNYSVMVTDANQCSATTTTPIAVSVINCCALTATATTSQTAVCVGGNATLSVNPVGAIGTLSYQWSPNIIPGMSQSITVAPATTTTYTVVVTDSGAPNCSYTTTVTVVVNPALAIGSITATPACVGQTLSLSTVVTGGTAPYSFIWHTPEGLTLSGNPLTRVNAQAAMSGTYTVVVSDGNSCSATQTISTTVGTAPSVQVQPAQACAGSSVTLTSSGDAASYSWIGPNGFTASGQSIVLTNVDASDAGSYTVVVTGGNSCTGSAQGFVAINPSPVVKADFVSTTVCVGSSLNLLGDITTGTVPPYTFSWTGPNGFASLLQNPVINTAQIGNSGSYSLVVTDQNGCSATGTTPVSVTVADCCPPRNAQISIVAIDPACGSTNGSATASLQPQAQPNAQLTYVWKNVANNTVVGSSSVISGLAAGVYSVTITETTATGCVQTFSESVSISETPGPEVSVSSVAGANCGASNGSVQLIVSGGNAPYSISWTGTSSGSMTAVNSPVQINGLSAGSYIFSITGGSSCQGIQQVIVPLLPTSLSLTTQVTQPDVCGASGVVEASWNSVGGPYQLTVDGVARAVTGTSQTLILAAGTHTIQIASGTPFCVSDSRVITINAVDALPVSNWTVQQQPICADQTGVISFSGGQSATTQYTLSSLNNTLIGGTTGNAPRTFAVGAGMYVVTRMEPNGCISTENFEIIAPAPISFNVKPTDGTCGEPGKLFVTNVTGGTPGYIITYSGPVSGSATVGATVDGLTPGAYSVTVIDSKGCSANTSFTIGSGGQAPVVTATINSGTVCVGGSFILNATATPAGNYTYVWRGPNSFTANGPIVTVNQATVANSGSYTVVVTSAEGCSTTQVTTLSIDVAVCQPPCAIGGNIVATSAHCNLSDGQATVTARGGSGNYAYLWSTGATTPTVTALATGVYSVTVIDSANSACFSTHTVVVGNEGGPQLTVASITHANCSGATGAVTVTTSGGSPGYAYQWNNGNTTSTLTAVIAGTYSVTVTDANGCQDAIVVVMPTTSGNLVASVTSSDATCNQANGTATVTATGGTGTYQYRWNNGSITNSISNVVSGIYSVTVTDANQCVATTSVRVQNVSGPQFTINKTNVSCQGASTGTASINITNGFGQLSYLWSTGEVTSNINGLSAGTYSVVVTDGNGCKSSGQVTITETEAIVAELSSMSIACGSTTGSINLKSITGGTPNYSYLWSNGATTPSLTGVAAGSYTLTITDANNCVAVGIATLALPTDCPPCINPVLTVSGPVCNPVTNTYSVNYVASVGATVTASAGTVSGSSVVNIPLGTDLVVTATNGCGDVSTRAVSPTSCPPASCTLVAQLMVGQAICVDGTSYAVSVTATAGATISVQGGSYANGVVTGVVGSSATVVATLPGCGTAIVVVASPVSCTDPCANPLVSLSGPVCTGTTYSIHYTAPAGVTITASAGVVSNGQISGIPQGVPVSVTALNGTCPAQVVTLAAPTDCPPCINPVLTLTGPVCNTATNTYSISYAASAGAIISASVGLVNPGTQLITGIQTGQNVIVTAIGSCGAVTSSTVVAPATCPTPPCTLTAGIKAGQAVCLDGTSYVVSVTANPGASLTAIGGTITGSVVTGVVGTNVTIVATITGCSSEAIIISSPICENPCSSPLVSIAGSTCEGTTYSVKYTTVAGVTIVSTSGAGILNTTAQTITGIPLGTPVSLTASHEGCPVQVIAVPAPACPIPCQIPILTVTGPVCNTATGTYSIGYTVSESAYVTASAGYVNSITQTVTGIPAGQNVVIIASSYCGAETRSTVLAPQTCTITPQCLTFVEISAGQAVCVNGTSYIASVTATAGATLAVSGGSIMGGVVTGVVGTNVTVTASFADCSSVRTVIASPQSCTPICVNPLVSIAGPICEGTTYSVKYTALAGVTVTSSTGVVNAAMQTITGITAGTPVSLTATNGQCQPQIVSIASPINCTSCSSQDAAITVPAVAESSRNWLVHYSITIPPSVVNCYNSLAYVATDAAGTILYVSTTPSFTGVTPGTYQVYATTYPINSVVGKNINTAWYLLMDYPCGWIVSAPYTVRVCAPTNEPPLVPGHPVVTEPGKPVTVCLPITDPNAGDTHTVRLCEQPAHGTVSLPMTVNNVNHTVCFTYTPNAGYMGQDQVCLITCDQGGLCDTTYVPITIVPVLPPNPVVQPPVVPVTPIVTVVDVPQTACYPILDPNVGDTHSFTVCGGPEHGTASVSINNATHQLCVTYTPNAGYSGPDELCLEVCDQTGLCTTVTVPIVVVPVPGPPTQPQPPVVVPPVIVTPVDVPQTVCVQINDPNITDIHTASICGQPTAGTLTVGGVNNDTHMVCVTYTPPAGYSGQPLGGCLEVCDQGGLCTQVPVTITVIPGPPTNQPPLVPGHPVVTEPGRPVTVCLPITDPNAGDTHTVRLCAQPAHGTVSLPMTVNNVNHTVCFTYTPNAGYMGQDQVCLITCDQGGLCDTTYVPITIVPVLPPNPVVQPPVVPVTPIVTVVDVPQTACYPILDPNVGDTHSFTVCGGPEHGTASVSINNATHQLCVTYTPNAGYSGPDELCLEVCDQTGLCTTVTVPIVVVPVPGPPTQPQPPVVVPPVIVTPVDVPQTVCVQINDPNITDIHTASICGQPTAGTLTVGGVNNDTHMVCVTYTPPAGYSGQPLGGCLEVCDQSGLCTQVPVTITVIPGPPTPCPTISVLPYPSDPTTCTANNGSLILTGLTAAQSYTVCYTKNTGAPICQILSANQNGRILISGLGVGIYTDIVVSKNGCTSNAVSVTLAGGLPAPTATCSVTAVCAGESITLTATGTNVQWFGSGLQNLTGSPVTAIPTVTGIVTYTAIQSANGCVSPPATVTVVVKPTPTFSVSATNPTVCNGLDGKITLTGLTPGQSYTVCYSKDNGLPVCAERLANINGLLTIAGLSAGSYTNITVNELGCLSTAKVITLTNPALPNPVVTVAPGLTICLGQPISLTATGQPGSVFTWKGQGLLSTIGNIVTVNPQSTGTLSYTVTQSIAGCGSSSAVTSITVNPVPSAVLVSKQDPNSCIDPNGIIRLGGLLSSQNYTVCYRVNNVGSTVCSQLSSNGTGDIVLAGLTSGIYSVTVSNGGCNSMPVSATLVGQTPSQPNVTVSPSATICIGQSVTLTASSTAEGSFSWTGPDLSGIAGGTIITTPTTTGVFNYTVTQTVNGCLSIPAIMPITVMSIPSPAVVATTAPTTCSGTNGSITLGGLTANQSYTVCSNSGGVTICAPFTAAGTGQLVVTNAASGAYSLTVLSVGGCYNAMPVSASVASSTACSVCTDAPLIIAQPLLICKDSTKTVSMSIIDADLSDSFSATICGVGMSNSTVTVGVDNQTRQLHITYQAEPGFQGIDQVCVTVRDKCGNFDQVYIPVQVIRCVCGCVGTPPVVVPQPIITTKNNPKEVCVPIVDTPADTHTAIICGGPQNGTAVVTVNNQTRMLCVQYTPKPGFVGTDKVCITICDQTNLCTTIEVPITVVDDSKPPTLSVVPLVTNCSSTTSAQMPIADSDSDNTHMVTIVSQPQNGTITATVDNVTHRLLVSYTPATGFMGNDVAVVRVTDSDGLMSDNTDIPLHVTPGTCPTCLTIELKVLLEGPYNQTTHKMNTVLNQRGLLPGQTPIEQVEATPAGQPYNTAPWNYTGTESVSTYAADVVDWVLVSLRSSELSTTPVFRVAGLLHDDGRITFVNPCFSLPEGQYFATVEHRNHMGVMSPTKVAIMNNKLVFDFTQQDSYTIADPPSFGEINIDGKWMMYGGDGKKELYNDNFDINFLDSKLWKEESGIFDHYRYGDFNMDADVNFSDSVLWKKNNGRYSKVPH